MHNLSLKSVNKLDEEDSESDLEEAIHPEMYALHRSWCNDQAMEASLKLKMDEEEWPPPEDFQYPEDLKIPMPMFHQEYDSKTGILKTTIHNNNSLIPPQIIYK